MDYTPKQVTNGYFEVEFGDHDLQRAMSENVYRYDYELGVNVLTISLLEYENSRYLELFQSWSKKSLPVTLHVLKPSARNRGKNVEQMQRYYTMTFNNCRMAELTNNGNVERVSYSNVKIRLSFEDYEIHYF
ncbi:MAG: hypothetical protein HQL53_01780 [Magnetococcales bacterium]|nr:hypothetical protein [Magnetococcales bacterium]